MSSNATRSAVDSAFSCRNIKPSRYVPSLIEDVKAGLLAPPRSLPPKYFYDQHGSDLFDKICDTDDYYPTRVESALLSHNSLEITSTSQPQHIVELGSGTSRKTRYLLNACDSLALHPDYWPMDVCEPLLADVAETLVQQYPWLSVNALVGDYHGGFKHFPKVDGRALYVFLGGTVGNFDHEQAVQLLSEIRGLMQAEDHLLVGFDRVKDHKVLEAAYNDNQGLTAEFNQNLLRVLNRELKADFELNAFKHKAVYNADAEQIEMYLTSTTAQTINVGELGEQLCMQEHERILTEISRKFTEESLTELLEECGFSIVKHFEADRAYYSLLLLQPA